MKVLVKGESSMASREVPGYEVKIVREDVANFAECMDAAMRCKEPEKGVLGYRSAGIGRMYKEFEENQLKPLREVLASVGDIADTEDDLLIETFGQVMKRAIHSANYLMMIYEHACYNQRRLQEKKEQDVPVVASLDVSADCFKLCGSYICTVTEERTVLYNGAVVILPPMLARKVVEMAQATAPPFEVEFLKADKPGGKGYWFDIVKK
jgi:hypothetical protein